MFGSFANVCIYRFPINKGVISGRSFCPNCKKKINWTENIPLLSFLILKGKCKNCKKKISFQYFLVEVLVGGSFIFTYINYINYYEIIFLNIFALIFIIIFFIDLKHFIIPDLLTFSLIFLSLIKNFFLNFKSPFTFSLIDSIVGGLFGFLIIWLIIYIYKKLKGIEAMGLGDAKFMIIVGLLFGWKSIPAVIFYASIIALITFLPALLSKTKNLKTIVPFGPFLIISTLIYYFSGNLLF